MSCGVRHLHHATRHLSLKNLCCCSVRMMMVNQLGAYASSRTCSCSRVACFTSIKVSSVKKGMLYTQFRLLMGTEAPAMMLNGIKFCLLPAVHLAGPPEAEAG